jgi:membrane protease YdiL (CAAX protease family)
VAVVVLTAVAETVVAYGDPRWGLAMHIVLLALALGLAARETDDLWQAFYLCACIGPIIRIISVGMPLQNFPQPFWYVLTSIPLFCVAYLIARDQHFSPAALKLRFPRPRDLPVEGMVALSGIGLGYVEWSILRPVPLIDGKSALWIVAGALILLVCTGLVEEVLFRGLIQHVAERFFGGNGGIAFTAAIFTVLHIGHLSIYDDLFVFVVGVYFSVVVRRTRSLLGVTLAHGAINTMLFITLPLSLLPHP